MYKIEIKELLATPIAILTCGLPFAYTGKSMDGGTFANIKEAYKAAFSLARYWVREDYRFVEVTLYHNDDIVKRWVPPVNYDRVSEFISHPEGFSQALQESKYDRNNIYWEICGY